MLCFIAAKAANEQEKQRFKIKICWWIQQAHQYLHNYISTVKPRPRTARLFRNRENENTVRIQENIELDIDGWENMFNISVEQPKRKYSKVSNKLRKSIDVEKIINNLNYFPNKPTILWANPVTREDPSWGNLRQKENGIMDMTEVKGYYEHLTLFLEDTIIQRRETPWTSLTPYINTEKGIYLISGFISI